MEQASRGPLKSVDWKDPAAVASALAKQEVTQDLLLNPSKLGGQALSDTAMDETGLTDRAETAFKQFRHGNAELRQQVAETAGAQLADLAPDSPQAKELNRIIDGLHLAMEMNGEKWEQKDAQGNLLREPLDEKMGLLARQMVRQGDSRTLLADSSEPHKAREAVRDALGKLGDTELQEMSKDTPWAPLAGLLGGVDGISLDPEVQELLRGLIRDMSMNNMTTNQGLINAVAGKRMPASNPLEVYAEMGKAFQKAPKGSSLNEELSSFMECIREAKDAAKCSEQADTIRRMQVSDMAKSLDRMAKETGVAVDPQNPHVAAVRHAAETGDLSILDEPLRPAKTPAEQKAEFLKNVKDPKERQRVQEMNPDEFQEMQQAIFSGKEVS
jgi:hypothetical protein